MNFGNRLGRVLKEKNITQYKLSQMTGIAQATISSLLHEQTKAPGLDTVLKIAKALNMKVSELIGEAEEELTPQLKELVKVAKELKSEEIDTMIRVMKTIDKAREESIRETIRQKALLIW